MPRKREAKDLPEYLADDQTVLPRKYSARNAARAIARLHTRSAGATFSMHFGDLSGQRVFAFSIFNTKTRYIPNRNIDEELIREFIEDNREIPADPRACIGTWFDEESGNSYLDISITSVSKQLAIRLAREYNQKGIFDLQRREEIATGGSGSVIAKARSEGLPPLRRGKQPK
jgi:hypothetical protein